MGYLVVAIANLPRRGATRTGGDVMLAASLCPGKIDPDGHVSAILYLVARWSRRATIIGPVLLHDLTKVSPWDFSSGPGGAKTNLLPPSSVTFPTSGGPSDCKSASVLSL